MDRRQFCAALGGLALLPGCRGLPDQAGSIETDAPAEIFLQSFGAAAARVVEVRWAAAVDAQGRVDGPSANQMLQKALEELLGPDPYRDLAGGQRRIGIKVNTIDSQAFSHPEVGGALARGLVASGSDPPRVTVWDRDTFGLRNRGYTIDENGTRDFRCLGTDSAPAGQVRSIDVAGQKVWLSSLLVESEVLINVAALKDHSMAGVSLCLKNNFGMISGTERLHGNVARGSGCEPGISELAANLDVRSRLRLCVIDALIGVCQGGPGRASDPAHVFRYAGVLVSRDPVAIDRRGLSIIEARRAQLGLPPLSARRTPNPSPAIHIDNAARLGVSPS